MSVSVEPLRDMVVIRPTSGPAYEGKLMVIQAEQGARRGEILSVGPEVRDATIGQRVIFSKLQGFELDVGEPVILLPEGAILASV